MLRNKTNSPDTVDNFGVSEQINLFNQNHQN